MRGARFDDPLDGGCNRIIPADAGSTAGLAMPSFSLEDHPRGCGEHWVRGHPVGRGQGSSPRMRGARSRSCTTIAEGRIIPADAGSTSRTWAEDPASKDHPRGCGEHARFATALAR